MNSWFQCFWNSKIDFGNWLILNLDGVRQHLVYFSLCDSLTLVDLNNLVNIKQLFQCESSSRPGHPYNCNAQIILSDVIRSHNKEIKPFKPIHIMVLIFFANCSASLDIFCISSSLPLICFCCSVALIFTFVITIFNQYILSCSVLINAS